MLYALFIAGLCLFRLFQLAMTVSLRPTDCTQLTAQGDYVSLPLNLLEKLCLAQAKPVMQATSVLMLVFVVLCHSTMAYAAITMQAMI